MQEDIELGVMESIASKVVMARMVELNGDKVVLRTKMFKKRGAREVPRVAVSITSDINN